MIRQSNHLSVLLLITSFFLCVGMTNAQPTISSLSVSSGNRGASVTINGTNFNTTAASNVVYFGATKAGVSSASSTSLSVTVPTGATFKPVSVLNTGTHLAAFSNKHFLPTFDNSPYISGITNFSNRVNFNTGSNPSGIAIGDIDGDGKADLVTANQNGVSISVIRNTSTTSTINGGSFASKVDFASDTSPARVAIADFDMDGKPDIAVINKRRNSVSILRNRSTSGSITSSSFATKVDFTTGSQPCGIAVGDVDKDGKPDLVVVNFNSNTVSVLRNTSSLDTITSGSFASKVDFTTGTAPTSVILGDIDGDGKPEIVVTNAASNSISIFRNTSSSGSITTSSFATKVDFTTANYPNNAAIGDLDGDGKPDLAVACLTGTNISVFRNTASSGSITTSSLASKVDFSTNNSPWVEIGDADGDGKPDLIVANSGANNVSVFRNTASSGSIASGSFASKVDFTTGNSPQAVAIGDLDGDGKPDLAAINNTDFTVSVFRNNPLSTIGNATTMCTGSSRTLTDSATGGSWSSSATSIATMNSSGLMTAVGAGTVNITYTVPGGYTTTTVTVNARPTVAGITPSATTICTGSTLILTAGAVSGTGTLTSYYWVGPDGSAATTTAGAAGLALTTTTQSGVYSVNVTYPGYGCTSATAVTSPSVTVSVRPTISGITSSMNTLCSGSPINFTAGTATGTGALSSYNWTGPNSYSATSTSNAVVFTPTTSAASGVYSLTVTYPGAGCTSPAAVTSPSVTVKQSPTVASITPSSTLLCLGTSLTLTAGAVTGAGSLTSYNWTGPNSYNATGTATTATLSPTTTAASGAYSLTITYSNGCTSARVVTSPSVTVNPRPTIASIIPSATSVCTGYPLTLTAGAVTGTGTPTSYNWTGPNSYSSTGTATTATFTPTTTAAGGAYSLTVTYPGTGCTSAVAVTSPSVTVRASPSVASITPSTTRFCLGTAMTLTAGAVSGTGSLTSYNWAGPAGYSTTSATNSVTYTPTTTAAAGIYSVTVTYSNGCTDPTPVTTSSVVVTVIPTVTVTPITFTTSGGGPDTMTAAGATTYTWSPATGLNATTGATVISTATVTTTYTVTGTTGCSRKATSLMTVLQPPVITSVSPNTANRGTAITITGSNFNATAANNFVYFGATKANVTSASSTSLTVTSPPGASYGPISVLDTTTNLLGQQPGNYLPKYNNTNYIPGMVNFNSKTDFASGSWCESVAIADIDGDGKPDIVSSNNGANTISVFRNISSSGSITSGSFAAKVDFTTAADPLALAIADIDGDGKLDIAVPCFGASKVSIFRNTSTAGSITTSSLASKVDIATGNGADNITFCDFDGDGKLDMAGTNNNDNNISIYRNIGNAGNITTGTFASRVNFGAGSDPSGIAAGDLDGDGKPDIAVVNFTSNTISVFQNTTSNDTINASSFAARVNFSTGSGSNPNSIIIGDLDGDGKPDIAASCQTSRVVAVFRNTSSTGSITSSSFAAHVDFAASYMTSTLALGDFNGDGKPDIGVVNNSDNNVSVIRNTSSSGSITTSSFAGKIDFSTGGSSQPGGLAVGDLDGDGKPDMVTANTGTNNISVFRNNQLSPIAGAGTLCVGSSLTLTDSATRGTWSSNATGIATVSSSGVVTAVAAGTAIITYSVTGGDDTAVITVNALPTLASITTSSTTLCTGTALTLTAGAVTGTGTLTSYNWSGPNGYSATGTANTSVLTPTTATASGVYSLTVTYPGIGCTSTGVSSPSVTVNNRPTIAGITSSANTVCTGNTLTFNAGAVTGTGTLTSYNWRGPNGYSASGATSAATLTPTTTAASGIYSVTVTYPGTGCTSAAAVTSPSITVAARPSVASITASTNTICTGTALTLTAGTVTGTGTLTSYNWTGPNSYSTSGTANTATFAPTNTAASGVYSLTVTYPGTGCTSTTAITATSVTVNARPTIAGISPSTTAICIGTALTLTAGTKTGTGTFISYNWTGPNGYSTTGTTTTAVFTPTTTAASGAYSLTVTYPGTGCTSTAAITSPSVTVNARPTIASITPSATTICNGTALTLTAGAVTGTGTLTSYNWNGPNSYSTSGTAGTAVLTPTTTAASGVYSLTVTYPGTGCVSTAVATSPSVTVNTRPTVASITPSVTRLCTGTAVTFTAGAVTGTGTLASYNWTGPNSYNTTGTATTAVLTPTTSASGGVYSLTVTYPGTGCTSTAAVTSPSITVIARPTIASIAASSNVLCMGTALTLTAGAVTGTGTITSYNWTGPNGYNTTGTSATAVFTPTTTAAGGVYSLTVTYPGTGCTSTAAVTSPSVTVNARPAISSITASDSIICLGTSLTLTAGSASGTGTLTSYNWSGPNSFSRTGTTTTAVLTPTITTAGGIYSLTVTYPGAGCTSNVVVSRSVTVNHQPSLSGSLTASQSTLCIGRSLTLSMGAGTTIYYGEGTALSYNWIGPNSFTATSGVAGAPSKTFTPASTAASGIYSLTLTTLGTGCTSSTYLATPSVTVKVLPTVAGITPSSATICTGTALTLSAGTATGTGTLTSYNWSGPNGFSRTGTSATTVFTPTTTAAGGIYTLSVTYPGAGCTSAAVVTSPSVTVNPSPSAGVITGTNLLCVGATTSLSDTATGGAWSSTNTSVATISGSGVVSGLSSGASIISYTVTNSCGTVAATKNVGVGISQWAGGTVGHETDWNTATNWACGGVPTASSEVFIPSGTTYAPLIAASGSGTTGNITIAASTGITLNTAAVLNVKGNLMNNGFVAGSGTIKLNGGAAQQITGMGTTDKMELNNSAGAAIQSGSRLTINNLLTITSGTLTTNDSLVLNSDSAITARVAAIPSTGAAIAGQVKVLQYIQGGYRRYRFWSHPFSNYIALSQMENYVDITGTGGASNGFTTTASNAPSAFRYNPLIGNSSLSSDPGWKPFTSAYGATDTNRLNRYQGIRLFFRGAKGEGLGYGTYTPSATTVGMWGTLNQGNQTIHLSKGTAANQDYNMVGNPYASPVDIGTVLYNAKESGNIAGSAFYVWNPTLGAGGQFQAILIGTSAPAPYYLQSCGSFQVRAANNGDSLNFTESNKGTTPSANLLRVLPDGITLSVYDANYHPWDMLYIKFNDAATDEEDKKFDATKPSGAGFNFYSLSACNQKLAVDARPYAAQKAIPLGISSDYANQFIIKAEAVTIPGNDKIYLHDKLLKQNILLEQGTEYRFTITNAPETQGNNRFELVTKPVENTLVESDNSMIVNLYPNPAGEQVNISFKGSKKRNTTISILDATGESVYHEVLGLVQSYNHEVKTGKLAAGIYLVEIVSGNDRVVQKLIKE